MLAKDELHNLNQEVGSWESVRFRASFPVFVIFRRRIQCRHIFDLKCDEMGCDDILRKKKYADILGKGNSHIFGGWTIPGKLKN